jgi:hypothetical protein
MLADIGIVEVTRPLAKVVHDSTHHRYWLASIQISLF